MIIRGYYMLVLRWAVDCTEKDARDKFFLAVGGNEHQY
jgi:hypothetical protein